MYTSFENVDLGSCSLYQTATEIGLFYNAVEEM